ncbi:MAG: SDR family NAD(P)-dependent oxidoreductase [Victivallaceae bacterium]
MAQTVLITGITGGFGRALGAEFKRRGFRVIGSSRRTPGDDGCFDEFIAADLSHTDGVRSLAARLRERGDTLDVLVNNAGIGSYATWEELGEHQLRQLMEIDFFAPATLTLELLPLLAASRGTVINISSVASEVPVACMGAYNSAKAALRLFSESLRPEVAGRGIKVLSVLPGRVETGFSAHALGDRKPPETPGRGAASPEALARRIFCAYAKGRREVVYPRWYSLVIEFVRNFPAVNEAVNRRIWKL